MTFGQRGHPEWLITHYPFGDFRWDGTLLITLLQQNPAMHGTVFELPRAAVQARARVGAAVLASRCDVIEGNALVGGAKRHYPETGLEGSGEGRGRNERRSSLERRRPR